MALRAAPQITGQPKWRSMAFDMRSRLRPTPRATARAVYPYRGGRSRVPRRSAFDQHRRLHLVRQQPMELDAPFFAIFFLHESLPGR